MVAHSAEMRVVWMVELKVGMMVAGRVGMMVALTEFCSAVEMAVQLVGTMVEYLVVQLEMKLVVLMADWMVGKRVVSMAVN